MRKKEWPRKGAKGAKIKAFCSAIVQTHSFSRRFVRGIIVKGIGRSRRNTIHPTSPLLTENKKAKRWRQKNLLFLYFCLHLSAFLCSFGQPLPFKSYVWLRFAALGLLRVFAANSICRQS
jgi:hypothetical protein